MSARLVVAARISRSEIAYFENANDLAYLLPRENSLAILVTALDCRACRDKMLVEPAHSRFSGLGLLSCLSGVIRRRDLPSRYNSISANNRFRNGRSLAGSSFDIKTG